MERRDNITVLVITRFTVAALRPLPVVAITGHLAGMDVTVRVTVNVPVAVLVRTVSTTVPATDSICARRSGLRRMGATTTKH